MKRELIAAVFGLMLIGISAYFTWVFAYGNFSGNVVLDENLQKSIGLIGVDGKHSSKIFLERGEERYVEIEYINSGEGRLDNCFITSGDNYDFIKFENVRKSISKEKNVKFIVNFKIPLNFDSTRVQAVNLSVRCDGFERSYNFPMVIRNPDIAFEIEGYDISSGKLAVYYNLDRSYFSSDIAIVDYKLLELNGKKATEGEKIIDIKNNKIDIDIPEGLSGEFDLIIKLKGKDSSAEDKIRVFISSTKITGFVVLREGGEIYPYLIVAIIIIVIFIASIKFLHWHNHRTRKAHHSFNKGRKYIKLDIN